MAQYLDFLDLARNELRNAVVQNLASAPNSPVAGLLYFDTTTNILYFYSGSAWVAAQGGAGSVTGVTGTAPIVSSGGSAPVISISAASGSNPGSMSAAHYALLTAATNAATASTLVLRDGSGNISVAEPTQSTHAATKNYVDAVAQGLDPKASVKAATTANITLSGVQTIDGVSLTAGDRVLVKNQTTAADNGIYVVAAGAWTRSTDANASTNLTSGAFTFVEQGTVNADSGWALTTDGTITPGTTSQSWVQFSGAGQIIAGTGIVKSGNTLALDAANGYGGRTFAADIGDGSSTSIVVTHNLGTRDVLVRLRSNTAPYAYYETTMQATSVNTVTLNFSVAPTAAQYRAIIKS